MAMGMAMGMGGGGWCINYDLFFAGAWNVHMFRHV